MTAARSDDDGDPVERLLSRVVTLPEDEQPPALLAAIAAAPELEAALRERYAWFRRLAATATAPSPATSGTERIGDYEIVRELGRGGMGVVLLARQRRGEQERLVALKVLHDRSRTTKAHERLRREGAAVFRLDHPGICQMLDLDEADGQPFLVMRYVAGETLAQHVARAKQNSTRLLLPGAESTTTATVLLLIENVARALHVAHEAGLVHRDVKPGNIMVTPTGAPVLLDFGLVRDDTAAAITMPGQTIGTPTYMAPEQIEPHGAIVDRSSDVYSLGATLFEALTLRPPFTGPTREALFRAILAGGPPRLGAFVPDAPRELDVVLATAMARDRHHRYASAEAFADDLRRVRTAEPILAKRASLLRRGQLWTHRNPVAATLLALLSAASLAIAWLAFRAEQSATTARAAEAAARADFASAETAIDDLVQVAVEHLTDVPWLEDVRRDLIDRALAFHRDVLQRHDGATGRRDLAILTAKAVPLAASVGDLQEAGALLREATERLREPSTGRDLETRRWLAHLFALAARLATELGDAAAAVDAARAAIEALTTLQKQHVWSAWEAVALCKAHQTLADHFRRDRRLDDARRELDLAIAITPPAEDSRFTIARASALVDRAALLRARAERSAADADLDAALGALRAVLQRRPQDRHAMLALGNTLGAIGAARNAYDDASGAQAAWSEARDVLERLVTTFPQAIAPRRSLCTTIDNLATLARRDGRVDDAERLRQRAVDMATQLAAENANSPKAQWLLAQTRYNLANTLPTEDAERAIDLYRSVLDALATALQENDEDDAKRLVATRSANNLAVRLLAGGRDAAARAALDEACAHGEALVAHDAERVSSLRELGLVSFNAGSLALETGDLETADRRLAAAVDVARRWTTIAPSDLRAHAALVKHALRLAEIGDLRGATDHERRWQAAAAVIEKVPADLRARFDARPEAGRELARIERARAEALLGSGDFAAATVALDRARTALTGAGKSAEAAIEAWLVVIARAELADRTADATAARDAMHSALAMVEPLTATASRSRLHRVLLRTAWPRVATLAAKHATAAEVVELSALAKVVGALGVR